jgi:uncharacterized repeat protein (TIGR03803 family)
LCLLPASARAGYQVLASFNGSNGSEPATNLLLGGNGNLYGTATIGGASSEGTVFSYSPTTGQLTTLASFNGGNGLQPLTGVVMGSGNTLYGTTSGGGSKSGGTLYKLSASGGTPTTLANFSSATGTSPAGNLYMDSSGNIYGTTESGGSKGYGTIFKYANGTLTALASFTSATGQNPEGGVVMDSKGNLYGTTQNGGTDGGGTIFEYNAATKSLTTLVNFNGDNGAFPEAGLVMDANGNLFGTTANGGVDGDGNVFEYNVNTQQLTTLVSFDLYNGGLPEAGLVMDANGNLYGTTDIGGTTYNPTASVGAGTVFELSPAGSSYNFSTLYNFTGSNGDAANPGASLVVDGSGDLFGTTQNGGAFGHGAVFEVTAAPVPDGLLLLGQGAAVLTALARCRRPRAVRNPRRIHGG